MVEWSQGNTVDDTRPKAKRRGLVGKIMKKKTQTRDHLHGRPAFVPDCWPDTLGLPLVDDFVKDVGRHTGPLQMVAGKALYLLIGKGDGMLRQREGTHVRRQWCSCYGRIGSCEHFCPCAHVCFIDVFDNVFEAELKGKLDIRIPCQAGEKTYPDHCASDKVVVLESSTKDTSHRLSSLVQRRSIIVRLRESVLLRPATLIRRHSQG